MSDLFDYTPTPPIGLTVQLVGAKNDGRHANCGDLATVEPGKAMHAASLRCVTCGGFRGWLGHFEFNWLAAVVAKGGVPDAPVILRNWNTTGEGETEMANGEYDNTNRGALFKNNDKSDDKHADYKGTLNVNGEEFWLNAWLKTSKKGMKFMSLSIKPKDDNKQTAKPDFNDEVPF